MDGIVRLFPDYPRYFIILATYPNSVLKHFQSFLNIGKHFQTFLTSAQIDFKSELNQFDLLAAFLGGEIA